MPAMHERAVEIAGKAAELEIFLFDLGMQADARCIRRKSTGASKIGKSAQDRPSMEWPANGFGRNICFAGRFDAGVVPFQIFMGGRKCRRLEAKINCFE
ncbi:MAG: hypothetical protein ACK5JM_14195 [Rhodoblastus sp.]